MPLFKKLKPPFRSPLQLFQKGATGAWYDPSTLWGAADHLPRRNLLTSTATLATQTKTVTAVSHTLYIKGTGSVTLSGVATGTLTGTGASDRVSLVFTPTAGSLTLTVSGTVTEGHLTTTATTDHSYQRVTDWITELYAHAASKNVPWLRRNLLLNTENISVSAYWQTTSNATAASDGKITEAATTATHRISWNANSPITVQPNTAYIVRCKVKKGTRRWQWFAVAASPSGNTSYINVDLDNGIFGTITSVTDVAISGNTLASDGAGWYDCVFTATTGSSTTGMWGFFGLSAANTTYSYAGDVNEYGYANNIQLALSSTTYQPIGASWEAQYAANAAAAGVTPTMYTDSAGTTPVTGPDSVVGKLNDLSGGGYHAIQSGATGLKPTLRLNPNGYWYIQRDLSDDALVTTFPNLGSTCASYINDGSTVTETTGVTLNGALTQSTPAADYGRIYLNAPSSKSAQVIKWLKAKAGL